MNQGLLWVHSERDPCSLDLPISSLKELIPSSVLSRGLWAMHLLSEPELPAGEIGTLPPVRPWSVGGWETQSPVKPPACVKRTRSPTHSRISCLVLLFCVHLHPGGFAEVKVSQITLQRSKAKFCLRFAFAWPCSVLNDPDTFSSHLLQASQVLQMEYLVPQTCITT